MSHQLGCPFNAVWMDPQRGTLCRGPKGPDAGGRGLDCWCFHIDNVPSNLDLLQEDVCIRFLTGLKSKEVDRVFVKALNQPQSSDSADLQFNQPTVVSSLTNTPIASATNRWLYDGEVGVLLGNGQTRFALNDLPTIISLGSNAPMWTSNLGVAWLSQAWSIFHDYGVSLADDLSQFELILPHIYLKLSLSQSKSKCERRRQPPIFLFIRPLPSTPLQSGSTSSFHYWSFKEDGHSPLSAAMCHYLGLPVALQLILCCSYRYRWTNDVYKTMHGYQVARGFDPSTIDFARSLGYDHPVYKPIQIDSDRFEEVDGMEGRDSPYFRPASPPVLHRSQISDESDIDTDDEYSNIDTDDGYSDADSNSVEDDASLFENHHSSPEMENLCTRFENMALVLTS
ncbi:hypothetical protein V5O48_014958 [Marasmius crinis-equi]|uniref:Uncharacterized protein n=1 Tax=Marasmius crinis-equi TaxID=585013 RepID=A0ABR3EVU8_9AGAR